MSAKGSLKRARDPLYQALFAIRGVSANVYKLTLDQIVGPKGNREFNDLITVMGCNVGAKFDLSKLIFNKIILATDADVDALFIRSLLAAFYFKLFPEIITDGRLYIAEPPLYRVSDKNNPFVINKVDHINRYVKETSKHYKVGFGYNDDIEFLGKRELADLLSSTASYVDDITNISKHYRVNDRLLEMIAEELAFRGIDPNLYSDDDMVSIIYKNMNVMIDRIAVEFPEIYFDLKSQLIRGVIDGKYQLLEVITPLIRKLRPIVSIINEWKLRVDTHIVLRKIRTGVDTKSSLLGALKILKKYQPNIEHRFKGLGENDDEDIKTTIMDPNTRMLIKLSIDDFINDAKIFQMLRGNSPADAAARREMMKGFKCPREMIDT